MEDVCETIIPAERTPPQWPISSSEAWKQESIEIAALARIPEDHIHLGSEFQIQAHADFAPTGWSWSITVPKGTLLQEWLARAPQQSEPELLRKISEAVEASRWILDLQDNWDDEGAKAYLESTWRRATGFLTSYARWYWNEHGRALEPPRIENGPDGSIDLHWETERFVLLINVPEAEEESLSFYGRNSQGFDVRGILRLEADYCNTGLLSWITQ